MSYLNDISVPRGIRNNNPGNLIQTSINWQGKIPLSQNTDSRFEQFSDMKYGLRALMKDLYNDISKGKDTIFSLISAYAPSVENNTTAYMNYVAKKLNTTVNTKLNLTEDTLIKLVQAIAEYENGLQYTYLITLADLQAAFSIANISLKKKL